MNFILFLLFCTSFTYRNPELQQTLEIEQEPHTVIATDVQGKNIQCLDLLSGSCQVSQMQSFKLQSNKITGQKAKFDKVVVNRLITNKLESNILIGKNILAYFEDFQAKQVDGWNLPLTSKCQGKQVLGGYCLTSSQSLEKTFELSSHHEVTIQGAVHMLDDWKYFDSVFLYVQEKLVWWESKGQESEGIDICGDSHADYKYGVPFKVKLHHTEKFINIKFNSTLSQDACKSSYAIDHLMILI